MNVAEMHIAVNQGVQKIASHQVDVLLPQEIDFELNKAQDKFVKNRYNQFGNKYSRGFEGSQKRIDDLRNLIKETTVNTTYKGQVADNTFVDTAVLPEDEGYMFLLNQRSFVVHNNCDSIQPCMNEASDSQVWIEIDFEEYSPNNYGGFSGTADRLESIRIACIDETGTPQIGTPYLQSMNPFGCSNLLFYTNPAYIDSAWSVFASTTPQNTSLTYTSANGGLVLGIALPVGWTLDPTPGVLNTVYFGAQVEVTRMVCGTPITTNTDLDFLQLPQIFPGDVYTRECDDIKYTASSVNRYSQLDDIYTLLKDPFNKTKHTSPLTTIVGHNIDIYTDETFYVPKVKLTYIKKPRSIDSTSGSVTSCELAAPTHQEIVDMAVASILAEIADPRYQTARVEEMRSE